MDRPASVEKGLQVNVRLSHCQHSTIFYFAHPAAFSAHLRTSSSTVPFRTWPCLCTFSACLLCSCTASTGFPFRSGSFTARKPSCKLLILILMKVLSLKSDCSACLKINSTIDLRFEQPNALCAAEHRVQTLKARQTYCLDAKECNCSTCKEPDQHSVADCSFVGVLDSIRLHARCSEATS